MIGFVAIVVLVAAGLLWLGHEWGYGSGWSDGFDAGDQRPAGGAWIRLSDDEQAHYDGSPRWPHGSEGEPL